MRKYSALFAILFLLVLSAGCGDPMPPVNWANQPPSGARITHAPELKVGEWWEFYLKNYSGTGEHVTYSYEVKSRNPDDSYDVRFHKLGTHQIYTQVWDKQHKFFAVKQRDGSLEKFLGRGEYNFPLWVGKRWTAAFDNISIGGGTYTYISKYVVVGYEPVTVPAGTFDAYKVWYSTEVLGESRAYFISHFWYAPEVKMNVKLERDIFKLELVRFGALR